MKRMIGGLTAAAVLVLVGFNSSYFAENQIKWANYTNTNAVQALASDGKYIWEGTVGGLIRRDINNPQQADVYAISNSEIPNNNVQSIFLEGATHKWIGTAEGVLHIREHIPGSEGVNVPKEDIWEAYLKFNSGLPNNNIKVVVGDNNGGVWFGTEKGLSYFSSDREWATYNTENSPLPDNNIRAIAVDGDNNKWIGTSNGLAKLEANGQWKLYNTQNSKLPSNIINVVKASSGYVWIGTDSGEAYIVPEGGVSIIQGLAGMYIRDIYADQKSQISVSDRGIFNYTLGGSVTEINTDGSNMPTNDIRAVLVDNKGIKWFGTSQGLFSYDGDSFRAFKEYNSLPDNNVQEIAFDSKGGKWLATTQGLVNIKADGTFDTIDIAKQSGGAVDNNIRAVVIDKSDGKWIGTGSGLAYLKKNGEIKVFNTKNSKLPSDDVLSIFIEANGTKWIGTSNGAAKLKGTNSWSTPIPTEKLPNERVNDIAVDEVGSVWLATPKGILVVGASGDTVGYDMDRLNISNDNIYKIEIDNDNSIWIGTADGIVHIENSGKITNYSVKNGLPDSDVVSIAIDALGGKWFGTNDGAAYLKPDGTWTKADEMGLRIPSLYINSIKIDNNGGKWFATNSGVAYAEPASQEADAAKVIRNKAFKGQILGATIWLLGLAVIASAIYLLIRKLGKKDILGKIKSGLISKKREGNA